SFSMAIHRYTAGFLSDGDDDVRCGRSSRRSEPVVAQQLLEDKVGEEAFAATVQRLELGLGAALQHALHLRRHGRLRLGPGRAQELLDAAPICTTVIVPSI